MSVQPDHVTLKSETLNNDQTKNGFHSVGSSNESNGKHINLIWGDFFMFVALLSSKRSRDPDTQGGACIVDKHNRIVAIGYDGLPHNCGDDLSAWLLSTGVDDKKLYIVHAEANAILHKNTNNLKETVLYTTVFPCNMCVKLIIQSGISQIFYISDKNQNEIEYKASKLMLDKSNVAYTRYKLSRRQYELNFNEILKGDPLCQQIEKVNQPIESKKLKVTEYLDQSDYFLAMSLLSAGRSKDPKTQVGACIVDFMDRIISIGYNGMPRTRAPYRNDDFPWGKDKVNELNDKTLFVVHAEANAILNRNAASIDGMRIYTTLFPCNECAKLIIQSGIDEVFYISDMYIEKPKYKASKMMFNAAGIRFTHLMPKNKQILLDFNKFIDSDPATLMERLQISNGIQLGSNAS